MKTKTLTPKPTAHVPRQKATDTTLPEVGMIISKFMDLMVNHPNSTDIFRQIYQQSKTSYSLHAANESMSIHFSVEWKGGKQ